LYQSLPRGFEVSGGMRYLRFHEPVRLYTGSVAKYLGSWLLTIRPYLSTDRLGPSHSYQFSARRYFRKETSWATFRFGCGASPTEVRSINEIELLNSQSFSNEWNLRLNRALALRFMAGIALNDRVERSRLRQYIFGGTLYYGF
jgi:YaiO family outer membrane protein